MKALIETLSNDSAMDVRRVSDPPRATLAAATQALGEDGPCSEDGLPAIRKRFPFKRSFPPLTLRHFKMGASYLE